MANTSPGIYLSIPDTVEFKSSAIERIERALISSDHDASLVDAQIASAQATLYLAGLLSEHLTDIKQLLEQIVSDLGDIGARLDQ